MVTDADIDLVVAAKGGDKAALGVLVSAYLPLVYNVVGRALADALDVEDTVQETMLQVVRGLPELRDPAAFRSWLVAIAMNQIRKHHRVRRPELRPVEAFDGLADPGSDFADLAVWELRLIEQRKETGQAAAWLDADDRELLSLWWLVQAGHLSRADMVAALEVDSHAVTVRVGRMKTQLETARRIVRALAVGPRCPGLAAVTGAWPGSPAPLWRKRLGRHVRECEYCLSAAGDLIPAERLLAGLALVPLPLGFAAYMLLRTVEGSATVADAAGTAAPLNVSDVSPFVRTGSSHRGQAGGYRARHWSTSLVGKPVVAAAAVVTTVGAAAGVAALARPDGGKTQGVTMTGDSSRTPHSAPAATSALSSTPAPTGTPSSIPTHLTPATPSSTRTTKPSVSKPTTARPTTNTPADQVLALINKARAAQGLRPYHFSSKMTATAAKHNHLMIDGCGFSHYCSGEPDPCTRDAGPDGPGNFCGENIAAVGPVADPGDDSLAKRAKTMTEGLLSEGPTGGHTYNLLSPVHVSIGISIIYDHGTVWMTQEFSDS